jgi:hypothetical protein
MSLHVYLFCHNEEVLLPHTIEHYRRRVPNATFTILDNESDDRSVEIARSLGCEVRTFSTGGKLNDLVHQELRNKVWSEVTDGWVIVADMDVWLCVTALDLVREQWSENTVLQTFGVNVYGESASTTFDDIDLHALRTGIPHPPESKAICFRRPQITAMNYEPGGHSCAPEGKVRWSTSTYTMKHMDRVGEAFLLQKYKRRFVRSKEQQALGFGIHYTDDTATIVEEMIKARASARAFSEAPWRVPGAGRKTFVRRMKRLPAGILKRLRRIIG